MQNYSRQISNKAAKQQALKDIRQSFKGKRTKSTAGLMFNPKVIGKIFKQIEIVPYSQIKGYQ